MKLLDRRLVLVLGKGGVGRTTLTAALGVAAARSGRRVCVIELGGGSTLAPKLGLPGAGTGIRHGRHGVDVWSLTVEECLDAFGQRKLKLPAFARTVVRNRLVATFVDAVPGLHDLLLLGRIEHLLTSPGRGEPRYDVALVDAPATGHGLTLLQAAQTMTEVTRTGPFFDLALSIRVLLSDRGNTGLAVTTLPEELPVTETIELGQQLAADGFVLDVAIANRVDGAPLPGHTPVERILEVLATVHDGHALSELAWAASDRAARQQEALDVLRAHLATLPDAPTLVTAPRADRDTVDVVSRALAELA